MKHVQPQAWPQSLFVIILLVYGSFHNETCNTYREIVAEQSNEAVKPFFVDKSYVKLHNYFLRDDFYSRMLGNFVTDKT